MKKLTWRHTACAVSMLCVTAAIAAPAQNFRVLADFNQVDGATARSSMEQGTDGNLYGTTLAGGTNNAGTVFKVSTTGVLTTLYNFCAQAYCTDGSGPTPSLALGNDGNFYGTTQSGGNPNGYCYIYGCGTVFKITPAGKLTILHALLGGSTEGANPYAGLVHATDGNFYGTTAWGGKGAYGTIFRVTPSGTFTTIYSVCSQYGCADGSNPVAPLIQASDGNLYGSTQYGGSITYGDGTIFKITLDGALTTLYSFDGLADGASPAGALVQGRDGNIYGTTAAGGNNAACDDGCGTIFSVNSDGALTTLYQFKGTDGMNPNGGLVQAADGSFYGLAGFGGGYTWGTAFKITPQGELTLLHAFDPTAAAYPDAALVQATNGNFYGTTDQGGLDCGAGCGTVFLLREGLPPFVKTVPSAAAVGRSVIILGTKLTGTSSVTFNGTPATFKVESATAIKATVPAGATAGTVQVVTPSSTLTSNVNFQVEP
jgi:uncharacterized repeat protein (TIGR03803 family)